MKKIALASAVALALISAAHAAPTVYGKAFLTADYVDSNYDSHYRATSTDTKAPSDDSTFKLNSNASRIGVKGSEPLTANTDVVYQLEYGIDVDSDADSTKGRNQNQFYSRNTYLGLANKQYGTLLAGRHDTPVKLLDSVDVFLGYSTLGLDQLGPQAFKNLGEVRANNVIAYKSPKMTSLPLTFMVATSLSEVDSDTDNNATEKDEAANGYSATVTYDQNGVMLGAGYDNNVGVEDQLWRIVGSVDMGKLNMVNGLKLNALYQNADIYNYSDDAKTWLVSGKYKIANTPWSAKAQYVNTDFGNLDTQEIALGGEYMFNANTTGHIYAGQIDRNNYKDDTVVGGGLEYKF